MLLITGKQGLLGQALTALMPQAIATSREELDITDAQAVKAFVEQHKIETIINCAAYTKVDQAEEEQALAEKGNVIGSEVLAQTGLPLIHISTDYVFDGRACRPYREEDATNPASVYGQTKRMGEKKVIEAATTAIIIRTSWLYGKTGKNFFTTISKLAQERDRLTVVNDQIGTPTYVGDLAQAIADIVPQIKAGTKEIYHYSNEGVCSWYDFAHSIVKLLQLSCCVEPVDSGQYPTKAVRPSYSVLNKAKIRDAFNVSTPHWRESLEKCLKQS